MFRGTTNPYDEIVVKATDENQTGENWEIILNLCDKVSDEGEAGARNVIAAVLKRLAHRNANVQLYSLAVVEALSKNCGIEVHREIASRAFTQGLEKLITDRTGHDKVKKKSIHMIQTWVREWEDDPSLGIMKECYESLKQKGIKFEQPMEAPPPTVDDDIRRREEEELQRVLELSMQDKGGRSWGGGYSASAGASSSRDNLPAPSTTGGSSSVTKAAAPAPSGYSASSTTKKAIDVVHSTPISANSYSVGDSESTRSTVVEQPSYQPSVVPPTSSAAPPTSAPSYQPQPAAPVPAPAPAPAVAGDTPTSAPDLSTATRVRALHNFEPADAGELAFERGDVIKVVDRTHKDWWKGQLKGRTGIFPVNYVEPMPEPTVADLAKEAEQEASVFTQAANIDRLLTMLRNFDINKDNLADNDEIQELYRSSLGVRPKIIRLIEKYNQKKVELAMMNDNFISAKDLFDRMMEESVARHTSAAYDWRRQGTRPPNGPQGQFWPGQYPQAPGGFYPPQQGFHDPNQAAAAAAAAGQYPPQIYPQMDPAAYAAQQAQQQQQQQQQQYPAQGSDAYQQQGYDPNAYAAQMQQQQAQQQQGYDPNAYAQQQQGAQSVQQPGQQPAGQPAYDPNAYAAQQQQQQQQQQQLQPGQQQQQPAYDPNAYAQQQQQQQQQQQSQPQPGQPQQQPAYDPNAYAQQQAGQQQPVHQGQPSYDPNAYGAQSQQHVPAQDPSAQQQQQPAPAGQQQPQPETVSPGGEYTQGPPYVYDPNGRYPDPNAQAWAQYYAAGGTDQAGAVYFHSVPGVKEPASASPPIAQVTQPTPTETPVDPQPQPQTAYQQQPIEQHQPHQSPHQSPLGQQQQLSPKSPLDQLKQSPRSKRISMAGVGTIAQHPELQSSLPTYAHELHGHRPGSAGGQSTGISPAVSGATPVHQQQQQPWGHQHQLSQGVGRATSPASASGLPGPMGPWTYGHPAINEPARTGSTSPPGAAAYNRSNSSLAAYGGMQVGATSPGGGFHPASAGPDISSNQPTPYPAFKPTTH